MEKDYAIVVDDTPANRDFLARLLIAAGYEVQAVSTGQDALDALARLPALELAMVDMQLPDMSGLQLTDHLRTTFPDACIVVATMYDDRSWKEKAFEHGCDAYLVKPYGFMELYQRLTTQGVGSVKGAAPMVIDQYGPRPFQMSVRTGSQV